MSPRVLLLSVAILGLTLLGCVTAITVLALNALPSPDILQNLGTGALTGLVGILVQSKPENGA